MLLNDMQMWCPRTGPTLQSITSPCIANDLTGAGQSPPGKGVCIMDGSSWKKVIVSSFVLGVAGIMTCISALLNDIVPAWSVLAFIAVLIPLALAIIAILAGFIWLCDKCENYFADRTDKILDTGKRESGKDAGPNGQNSVDENRRYVKYMSPRQTRLLEQYNATLRGSRSTEPTSNMNLPPTKAWHGQ